MTRIDQLPDDPALLKRLFVEQEEEFRAEREAIIHRIKQEGNLGSERGGIWGQSGIRY